MTGEVSLTCNAWQAGNADAYFAVTSHWIEECAPGEWTIEQALFGFIQMNTAHNSVCLGQALYKVCNCLLIMPKVSTDSLCVVLLISGSLGRAHHLRQRQEQQNNASRVCTLLPHQDGSHLQCDAPTHQVSHPSISLLTAFGLLVHTGASCI